MRKIILAILAIAIFLPHNTEAQSKINVKGDVSIAIVPTYGLSAVYVWNGREMSGYVYYIVTTPVL